MGKPPNKLVGVENNRWFLNSLTMRENGTQFYLMRCIYSLGLILLATTLFLHP